MAALALVGRVLLAFLSTTGRLTMFAAGTVVHCFRPPIYPRPIRRQVVDANVLLAESALLDEETS